VKAKFHQVALVGNCVLIISGGERRGEREVCCVSEWNVVGPLLYEGRP